MSDETRLEAKARAAFDAGVERVDAATRSRLNRARHAAVAELERRPLAAWGRWALPAGAAAAAVLAVAVWRQPETPLPGTPPAMTAGEFDVLALGEDLDMLAEDPEFYSWALTAATEADGNGIG